MLEAKEEKRHGQRKHKAIEAAAAFVLVQSRKVICHLLPHTQFSFSLLHGTAIFLFLFARFHVLTVFCFVFLFFVVVFCLSSVGLHKSERKKEKSRDIEGKETRRYRYVMAE